MKRLGIFLVVVVFLATGCSGSQPASTGAGSGKAVKIGFLAEESGAYQAFGVPAEGGIKLAVEQINKTGFDVNGQHYTIQLLSQDDRSQETDATSIATGYVRDQDVKFVFGGIGKLAPLVLQITNPAKTLFFTPSSAASQFAGTANGKYMVTTAPALDVRTKVAVDALLSIYPQTKRVQLMGAQIVDNQTLFPALSNYLKTKGATVLDPVFYQEGTTDFSGILTTIKRGNPDVVFVGSTTTPTVTAIVKQNEDLQAVPRWFLWGVGCSVGTSAGAKTPLAADPLVGADLDNPQTDKARQFVSDYRSMIGTPPPGLFTATWNYDFIFALVQAMKKAGSVDDTDKIVAAFRGLTYDGLVGKISFDDKNEAQFGFDICQLSNGAVSVRHFNYS